MTTPAGKLILVPTPIGNLDDITLRALNVLRSADAILCEDTRHSARLFAHHSINTATQAFHQHNEHMVTPAVIERLRQGQKLAMVSDAGTPGISDAGYLLVRECIRNGIAVECLPGATAIIPAVVVSGLPSDKFVYLGFPPQKKGRKTFWDALVHEAHTMVMYESPHRIKKALNEAREALGGERQAVVVRELTKIHESYHRGNLEALCELAQTGLKGEIVLVIEGSAHYEKRMKT